MIEAELDRLGASWRRFWPGADHEAMAADVRARLRAAAATWKLRSVEPLGGGDVALVCAATQEDQPVVLKLNPRGDVDERYLTAEAAALETWSSRHLAPALLGTRDANLTLLMERLEPGRPLDATPIAWEERLTILGTLAGQLHTVDPPAEVPAIADYGSEWHDLLATDHPAALRDLEALLADTNEEVLLHADLHGGNALSHNGDWVAIDPHAVRGDRHAEVWALIDPLAPAVPGGDAAPAAARHAAETYAAAADLDPRRAARWALVRALAEASAIERSAEATPAERAWGDRLRRFAEATAAWLETRSV